MLKTPVEPRLPKPSFNSHTERSSSLENEKPTLAERQESWRNLKGVSRQSRSQVPTETSRSKTDKNKEQIQKIFFSRHPSNGKLSQRKALPNDKFHGEGKRGTYRLQPSSGKPPLSPREIQVKGSQPSDPSPQTAVRSSPPNSQLQFSAYHLSNSQGT